jgi:hypothetical protein
VRLRRPSCSTVVASVALFAALGGSSYAAISLPKGSVGTKQIRANAVRSSKVKDHSLLARDFKPGQLPAGPRGPKGDAGPKGNTGAPGTARAYARVVVSAGGATVDPAQSKGVTTANVSRRAEGVTCFKALGFTPKAIVVSADIGVAGSGIPVAGGALAPSAGVKAVCGPSGQAAVATLDPGAAPVADIDASYFVIFE